MSEALQLGAELLEKYPPSKGFPVATITSSLLRRAGRGFLQPLFHVFKVSGVDPVLQGAIKQLYLNSLPALSWAKHGIHREARRASRRIRGARSPTTCSTARVLPGQAAL